MKTLAGLPGPTLYRYPPQEGCMGYVTGLLMTGTSFWGCFTDTTGWYDYDSANDNYVQAVNPNTISAADVLLAAANNAGNGCFAAAKATGVNRYYMIWGGYFWRRDGGIGVSWTKVCTAAVMLGNSIMPNSNNGDARIYGLKMAVDPQNPDVVYVGAPSTTPRMTINAGVAWSAVGSIGTATGGSGDDKRYTIIAIDGSSSLTSGRSSVVYFSTTGRGFYRTTDGGGTTTLIDAARDQLTCLTINPNDNTCWGVDSTLGTNNGFKWTSGGGFVATVNDQKLHTICFKLGDVNLVAGHTGGSGQRSTNGGLNWSIFNPVNMKAVNSGRSPLVKDVNQQRLNASQGLSCGQMAFDGATNAWKICGGYDVYEFSATQLASASTTDATNPLKWFMGTKGMADLNGQNVYWFPKSNPIAVVQDEKAVQIPANGSPVRRSLPFDGLGVGMSADFAPEDYNYQVFHAGYQYRDGSGLTTDGGITSRALVNQPPYNSDSNSGGGKIAVSAIGKMVWAGAGGMWPRYTLDGGATPWIKINVAGVTPIADKTGNGFGNNNWVARREIVIADKLNPGTYYMYNDGTSAEPLLQSILKSVNHGVDWTRVNSTAIIPNSSHTGYHLRLVQPLWLVGNTLTTVPGCFVLITGPVGNDFDGDNTTRMYLTTNYCVNWAAMSNCYEVAAVDFGPPATGFSEPTLIMYGWGNGDGYTDKQAFWKSHNPISGNTLQYLGDRDMLSMVAGVACSPDVYGEMIATYTGHGTHRYSYAGRGTAG